MILTKQMESTCFLYFTQIMYCKNSKMRFLCHRNDGKIDHILCPHKKNKKQEKPRFNWYSKPWKKQDLTEKNQEVQINLNMLLMRFNQVLVRFNQILVGFKGIYPILTELLT